MSHVKIIRRTAIAVPVATTLIIALVGAASVTQTQDAGTAPAPRAGLELAVASARGSLSAASQKIAEANRAVTEGRDDLASSEGHVLDQEARSALASAIDIASAHIDTARSDYLASQRALAGAADAPLTLAELPLQLSGIRVAGELPTVDLEADVDAIAQSRDEVKVAVDAWQAEQDRLAAEKAAQEAAEREAAARAQYSSRPASSGGHSSVSSGVIDVYVRGWVDVPDASAVPRAQAAVDAGGQVAINYQQVGVVVVSAHNYSDSTALRLRFGDTVRLSGALSGTYRVVSDIWVGAGSSVANLQSLGTSVAMQTCGTSSMRVVGLSRIG